MSKMKNISQRRFIIAGKELKQGETADFAQSVVERHVAMYPTELEAVGGEEEKEVKISNVVVDGEKIPVNEEDAIEAKHGEWPPKDMKAEAGKVDEDYKSTRGILKEYAPTKYPSQMNKGELQAYLTDKGISFPDDASKKELLALTK